MKTQKLRVFAAIMAAVLLCAGTLPCALADPVDKKEMVYALAEADGTVSEIIVSERLYNRESAAVLRDESRLTGIENVGGEQTFEQNNERLIWQANGEAISYEGTSEETLPVGVSIRYLLDGQEIKPEALAGKSGHLVIQIDYQATRAESVSVGEEREDMVMPFLMATALLADKEVYRNIEVTNGHVIDAGNLTMVLCFGLPGLSEALRLDEIEDFDLDIPVHAEISADVTDYSCSGTYTLATNSFLKETEDGGLSLDLDVEGLKDDLGDAIDQLLTGAEELRDGAGELKDGAAELADGLAEIDANSQTLTDAAAQVLDTVLTTANDTLAESRADFARLGITLNPLTAENYDAEIGRLERELLANVEDYVYRQADETLKGKVSDAVRAEVISQVKAAAQAQVEAKVLEAVQAEVQRQVEAGAQQLVVSKVQEGARAQVRRQVEAAVREKVCAAVESAARQKVEDAVRHPDEATLNAQIEQQMQSDEVQAQVEAALAQQMHSDEVQKLIDAQLEPMVRPQVEAAFREQISQQVSSGVRRQVEQQVRAAVEVQVRAEIEASLAGDPDGATKVDAAVQEKMASDAIQAAIAQQTDDAMAADDVQNQIDTLTAEQLATPDIQAAMTAQVQEKMADPTVRAQAEETARPQVRAQVEAAAREKIRGAILSLSDAEVAAVVEKQMASDDIRAQMETEIASQMALDSILATIQSETDRQMKSETVQKMMADELQKQMTSEAVQATVQAEVERQMKSDAVQQKYLENVEAQMNSAEVKALINQNIDEQMQSSKVHDITREQIEKNRHGAEYLNSVARALEENGENGAAYQALVQLHDTLDDMIAFYDGICSYTDAVGEAAEGAASLKDGAQKLYDGACELFDGLNEFNEKAIQKLMDALGGGLDGLADRAKAMMDLMESYHSYAGIAEGMSGSVQFLIHTSGF